MPQTGYNCLLLLLFTIFSYTESLRLWRSNDFWAIRLQKLWICNWNANTSGATQPQKLEKVIKNDTWVRWNRDLPTVSFWTGLISNIVACTLIFVNSGRGIRKLFQSPERWLKGVKTCASDGKSLWALFEHNCSVQTARSALHYLTAYTSTIFSHASHSKLRTILSARPVPCSAELRSPCRYQEQSKTYESCRCIHLFQTQRGCWTQSTSSPSNVINIYQRMSCVVQGWPFCFTWVQWSMIAGWWRGPVVWYRSHYWVDLEDNVSFYDIAKGNTSNLHFWGLASNSARSKNAAQSPMVQTRW